MPRWDEIAEPGGGARLDLRAAGRRIGCSLRRVYELVDTGELPAWTFGSLRKSPADVRIFERDVDDYLGRQT